LNCLQHRDPASALALAESITAESERYKLMASVADRWGRSDQNAAAIAVLGSSMPDEMKRKYAMKVSPSAGKDQAFSRSP